MKSVGMVKSVKMKSVKVVKSVNGEVDAVSHSAKGSWRMNKLRNF